MLSARQNTQTFNYPKPFIAETCYVYRLKRRDGGSNIPLYALASWTNRLLNLLYINQTVKKSIDTSDPIHFILHVGYLLKMYPKPVSLFGSINWFVQ